MSASLACHHLRGWKRFGQGGELILPQREFAVARALWQRCAELGDGSFSVAINHIGERGVDSHGSDDFWFNAFCERLIPRIKDQFEGAAFFVRIVGHRLVGMAGGKRLRNP